MRRWLWLVGALCVLPGCARRTVAADGEREPAAYYPLALGNSWTFDLSLLGEKRSQTVKIIGEQEGYFVDDAGGRLRVDSHGIRDDKRYLLRKPVESGNAWTNVVSASSVEKYRIVSVGRPCQAPAGEFQDCVQVEGRNRVQGDTDLVSELTFAPGVGVVRIEVVLERKGVRIPQTSLSLRSYQVRKSAPPG